MTDVERLMDSPGPMAKHPHSGANYYEGADIIAHLNRCLGPAGWSWTTGEHGYDELADQVYVVGTLTIKVTVLDAADDELVIGTTHTERGWQTANRKRSDGAFVDLGNDYKAADTDALKRAARLAGVGLDAWMKGERGQPKPMKTKAELEADVKRGLEAGRALGLTLADIDTRRMNRADLRATIKEFSEKIRAAKQHEQADTQAAS